VVGTDAEHCVTLWNPAAERLYGYSAEEAMGRPARELATFEGDTSRGEIEAALQRGAGVPPVRLGRRRCREENGEARGREGAHGAEAARTPGADIHRVSGTTAPSTTARPPTHAPQTSPHMTSLSTSSVMAIRWSCRAARQTVGLMALLRTGLAAVRWWIT
jgi:PAS domain-containing protein